MKVTTELTLAQIEEILDQLPLSYLEDYVKTKKASHVPDTKIKHVKKSKRKPKAVFADGDIGHWDYPNKNFCTTDYDSFTYKIVFPNKGLYYYGYKTFSKDDWRSYTSSSKLVNHLLSQGEEAEFYIIQLHKTRTCALTYESDLLRDANVPNNPECLNIVVEWEDAGKTSVNHICEGHYYNTYKRQK